jgi:twitching motility protein PilT
LSQALIDRLIQAMFTHQGLRLHLVPGQQVMLGTTSSERAISAKELTAQQIEGLIDESAPPEQRAQLSQDGRHTYAYASPSGAVNVNIRRQRGAPMLTIEPATAGIPSPAAAPAPAPKAAAPAAIPSPAAASAPAAHPPSASAGPDDYTLRPDAPEIERFFLEMVQRKCSDLHFTSNNPPLYRKDGDIVPLSVTEPMSAQQVKEILYQILPERNRAEFESTNDTDFAYEMKGLARFRCNFFMDRFGVGAVFRQIPDKILTAEDLKLSPHILELCNLNKGLVVVTGPTGSGKSTTLAAMVDYINRNRSAHIITIEDPVEFVHPNKKCLINQREVHVHTKSFKAALRAALREDPDIVLVGEMRDLETVAIAIETAETGHLVFGTLHTNTAPSTVDRIIDQFPTNQQAQIRTMLSESLKGVVAQTLCKKKGGGRIAALEVLVVNAAISNLIREGKTFQIPSMMQTGRNIGMVTLTDALIQLVTDGLVDPEEAYFKAVHKEEVRRGLGQVILFPDDSLKEVVEAPDQATADALCRDAWQKKGKPRPQKNDGIDDVIFSKRMLLRGGY